jgi:hypothetical protein
MDWELDRIGTKLCPLEGFGISSAQPSVCVTRQFMGGVLGEKKGEIHRGTEVMRRMKSKRRSRRKKKERGED